MKPLKKLSALLLLLFIFLIGCKQETGFDKYKRQGT